MGILTAIVGRYLDSEKSGSTVQFDRQRCSAINGQCGFPCVQACLNKAIYPDEEYVDHRKCGRCGSCISRCPNGAISLIGYPDLELVRDIVYAASEKKGLRFYCNQSPGGRFKSHPLSQLAEIKVRCLARLYPGILLYSLAAGIDGVWADISGCEVCPDNRDGCLLALIGSQIDQAQQVMGTLGRDKKSLCMDTEPPADFLTGLNTAKNLDRREFFTFVRKEIRDYSRKIVDDFTGSSSVDHDRSTEAGPNRPARTPPLSRMILLAALQKLCQEQADYGVFPGQTMIVMEKKCSLCGICSSCCPTGALRQAKQEAEMTGELFFRPAYCIDCGICRKKCPNDLISFKNGIELTIFRNRLEIKVFAAELRSCKKCKALYVTDLGENGLCDICSHKSSVY